MPSSSSFPARLKTLRTAKGLSQFALGQAAEVHEDVVSRYEMGKNVPTLLSVHKLAGALGVHPGEVAFGRGAVPGAWSGPPGGTFGSRLKLARERAGLALATLAKRASATSGGLSMLERSISHPDDVQIDAALALARALGVCPGWLAYGQAMEPMRPVNARSQDA